MDGASVQDMLDAKVEVAPSSMAPGEGPTKTHGVPNFLLAFRAASCEHFEQFPVVRQAAVRSSSFL
eukprot:13654164-Alexandrium_andersonii.AAC.1